MGGGGLLISLLLYCLSLLILYVIIQSAVKNGILEADNIRERKKQEREKANTDKSNNLQDNELNFTINQSTNHSSKDDEQIKY